MDRYKGEKAKFRETMAGFLDLGSQINPRHKNLKENTPKHIVVKLQNTNTELFQSIHREETKYLRILTANFTLAQWKPEAEGLPSKC